MAQNWNRDDRARHRNQGSDWDKGWQDGGENRDQDRQLGGRGTDWLGQDSQDRGFFGGGERSGGRSGNPLLGEGGEWNRMGRYGDDDRQGSRSGGQGWQQDHDFGMERGYGYGRSGGQGYGGYGGGSDHRGSGFGRSGSSQGGSSWRDSMGGGSGGHGSGRGERGFFEKAGDEVSSWFGDDDAQRRRERDQHRGRGPKGYARSDDRIREDVNDRLTDDNWLDASDIEVQVSGAEVTLTGHVRSREDKRRAEDIAEAVSGVSHVQNNLRVKSSQSSGMSEGQGSGSMASGSSSMGASTLGTGGSMASGSGTAGASNAGNGGSGSSGKAKL